MTFTYIALACIALLHIVGAVVLQGKVGEKREPVTQAESAINTLVTSAVVLAIIIIAATI